MNRSSLAGLAAILVAAGAAAEDSISLQPGQWSFENTMSGSATMGDGPGFDMPARASTAMECITPENSRITPDRMLREMREEGGGDCQYGDIAFNDLTVTTTITCASDGVNMAGDYTFTVAEDRRSGTGRLAISGVADGMNVTTVFDMTGRHTGSCNPG